MKQELVSAQLALTLRDLYPELNDAELEEAEETLEQYIEVVLRIYNRLELEKKAVGSVALTPAEKETTMIAKTSKTQ